MNTFARYLFQGMFGWMRAALLRLADGTLLDSWLARHWLTAIIPVIVIGTLIDYIVWIARWRPDLSWRSDLRRSAALLSHEERQMRRFRRGYNKDNAEIGAVAQPLSDAPVPDAVLSHYDALQSAAALEELSLDERFAAVAAGGEATPVRHRRSDRYRSARRQRDAQRRQASDADAPADGLAPVISKATAFRAPVYPRQPDQDTRS